MAKRAKAVGRTVENGRKAVEADGDEQQRQAPTRKRAPARRYGTEEIERGLIAVAEANGNTRSAAESLAQDGLEVDHRTLHRWVRKAHVERYERIQVEVLPRLRERAAEAHRDLAERQMAVERQMADRLAETVGEIPVRDLPGGMRNVATSVGIHTDKAEGMSGRPMSHAVTEFAGIIRELHEMGVEITVDGSAEEEPVVTVNSTATEEPLRELTS